MREGASQVLVRFGGQICDLLQTIGTAPGPLGNLRQG